MTRLLAALTSLLTGLAVCLVVAAPARAGNVVTPGDFTGHGFDQCVAPSQSAMTRWLDHSPFLAVGIYISGDSRGCRSQPNLTPAWVSRQLRDGWRLLPITLGPQASCHPSFPRYGDDVDIDTRRGTLMQNGQYRYDAARKQGQAEALDAIAAAQRLGIAPGSTLWYDLEGFDLRNEVCRESALAFVSGWSWKLKQQGWVSGLYSSASSGIVMVDDARTERPRQFNLPTYLWIARWDGRANTSTTYISEEGWNPHRRVKQYRGDHRETWGGVTIDIDSNWLDVGRGSVATPESRCGGVRMDFPRYDLLRKGVRRPGMVKALQCLLTEKRFYAGPLSGVWTGATWTAANNWRRARGLPTGGPWTVANWVAVWADGARPALKVGSAGADVRRLQRALIAAGVSDATGSTGTFEAGDTADVRAWQARVGQPRTGVMATFNWPVLQRGRS